MASLSLREAAEQAGTSKSTIWRAIKSGRMSATRTDDGGFAIDPPSYSAPSPRNGPRNVSRDKTQRFLHQMRNGLQRLKRPTETPGLAGEAGGGRGEDRGS